MKLCKDCAYSRPLTGLRTMQPYDFVCEHPGALKQRQPDYVTGRTGDPYQDKCVYLRDDPSRCGPEAKWFEPVEDIEEEFPEIADPPPEPVEMGFGDRRQQLADAIIEDRPITEDDEGAWEWYWLSSENTGVPLKIWLCEIAPVVLIGETFPARADINRLYKWMQLNDEILENLGLYSSRELERLKKLK